MKTNWKGEWPHLATLAAMFGLAAASWSRVGHKLPVHWGIDGQVDRYGGKFEGLLLLPLVALALYALFLALPRLDPGRANYAQFAKSYSLIRLATLGFLLVIQGVIVAGATGHKIEVSSVILPAVGMLFVVLGNAMGKFRPNWFVGIRTPWTLSSKTAWIKTHRVGGWAFIAMGVAQIVAGLVLTPGAALWLLTVLPILASIGLSAYSYLVWQSADDKGAPAGTSPADA